MYRLPVRRLMSEAQTERSRLRKHGTARYEYSLGTIAETAVVFYSTIQCNNNI